MWEEKLVVLIVMETGTWGLAVWRNQTWHLCQCPHLGWSPGCVPQTHLLRHAGL